MTTPSAEQKSDTGLSEEQRLAIITAIIGDESIPLEERSAQILAIMRDAADAAAVESAKAVIAVYRPKLETAEKRIADAEARADKAEKPVKVAKVVAPWAGLVALTLYVADWFWGYTTGVR